MRDISTKDILHAMVDLEWTRARLATASGTSPNAVSGALNHPASKDPRRRRTVDKIVSAITGAGYDFEKRALRP